MTNSQDALTQNELWRWCLRADAVAQCYIRDVIALRESEKDSGRDQDAFWWLGTVPCRSVRFVGILVGASAYEKRTVYTVDDGTGVIQCVHLRSGEGNGKRKPTRKPVDSMPQPLLLDEIPKPLYEVGDILRVAGRVTKWNESFQINVNDIELCRSNEEPDHWLSTAKLHETYYTQPFTIPPLPPPLPRTPVKPLSNASAHTTPHTTSTVATPSTVASASSTVPSQGAVRLRDPSRLRSKELISSTFKIYLKNYMDVLSDPAQATPFSQSQSDDYPSSSSVMESPTKKFKRFHNVDELSTPTPKNRRGRLLQEGDDTPRPSGLQEKENVIQPSQLRRAKGFTLSYLRRVPELANLALRVVGAEIKRRTRDARRKQKETAKSQIKSQKTVDCKPIKTESTSRKVKRLYVWAIRELHREGSIILHEDGAPAWETFDTRDVWKQRRRLERSVDADSTSMILSDPRGGTHGDGASLLVDPSTEDRGELSEPPEHEESYIPLTPALLTEPIMDAIKSLMMRKPAPRPDATQQGGAYRHTSSRAVGPTAEDIHDYLGKCDERWENVSEYVVTDALQLLKEQDRVYKVGKGRWEISL